MSTTIDFGIDLGTTNSAIAIARGGEVRVLKNRESEVTPSMVAYDQRGTEKVGLHAKGVFSDPKRGPDVQAEFKRRMGQNVRATFANGIQRSPEELSAVVLGELRRAAAEQLNCAPPSAAVITVPAMFELPQNEATAKAGRLAGFDHSQLLQEPVAAAIAYGLTPTRERALWMVYDFGGGTFDTSIVSIRDDALNVVRHAGDNYLGGADFDWIIVDRFLLPVIGRSYDIGSLRRHDPSHRDSVGRLRRLKAVAEEIKVELSRCGQVHVYRDAGEVFEDDRGRPVELDVRVTREEFEAAVSPNIDRSMRIVARLLEDSRIAPGDLEKVVMVGGTTFIPLVRQRVSQLGVPLALDLDPMTVVARGAAVFAASQRLPDGASSGGRMGTAPSASGAELKLEYEPVTRQSAPLVGGQVLVNGSAPLPGTTISIARDDDGFTSGKLPVDAAGMFFTSVQIRERGQTAFRVSLWGPDGTAVRVHPDRFAITNGLTVGRATLPAGCAVALDDGSAKVLAQAGSALPLTTATHHCETTKPVVSGSADEIVISFLSGDEDLADHNLVSARVHIRGSQIRRDLPRGTKVEITIEIDGSGTPVPRVYVPLLDEVFEPATAQGRRTVLEHETADVMFERLAGLEARLTSIREMAERVDQPQVAAEATRLATSGRVSELRDLIRAWGQGEDVSAGRARNELVELARECGRLGESIRWPALVQQFQSDAEEAREIAADIDSVESRRVIAKTIEEGERAIAGKDPRVLEAVLERLAAARSAALQSDPRFWASMLAFCADNVARFPDRVVARELLAEGAAAVRRGDASAAESIARELIGKLPSEVAEMAQRTGIRSDIQ